MIRGCQKRIYYIKDTRSALFSEAYFILKTDRTAPPGENELASEAQRIVADFDRSRRFPCRTHENPIGQKLGAFVVGAASSSAVIGGIALLLAFA